MIRSVACGYRLPSPETNSLHLKMDGRNMKVSFWDGLLSGAILVLGLASIMFLYMRVFHSIYLCNLCI